MISEAKAFWDPISGKVKDQIAKEMGNALQVQRYDVTTDPDGDVMGVTQPFGSNEIFLPYSKEVAGATVGDTVLVAWWGSMSNARVYYFAKGYDGGAGGGDAVIASITFPAAWTDSGNGYYTSAPTIDGVTLSAESRVDLLPDAAAYLQMETDGVLAMYVENIDGALTGYAVGEAPTVEIIMQCTITGTNAPTPPVNPSLNMIYPIGSIYMNVSNVNPGNTIGGTWERIENNSTYLQKELLWTNFSPTTAFAAQTVALDLSGYDGVLIDVNCAYEMPNFGTCFVCMVGRGVFMDIWAPTIGSKYNREATVATTGVTFGQGYFGTGANNNCAIPYRIYGIKETSPFDGLYRWKRTA